MPGFDWISAISEVAGPALVLGFGLPLAFKDVKSRRLPNRLVAMFSAAVVALVVAASFADWNRALAALFWSLVTGALAIVLALLLPRALGMGDAKVVPGLTAVIALSSNQPGPALLLTAWLASFSGLLVCLALRLRSGSWPQSIAYGPHLFAATLLVSLLTV